MGWTWVEKLFLFTPLILFPNLFLFSRSEVVLDVECFPDLFWSLPLYHVSYDFARHIQETFDIEVVGGLKNRRLEISS